MTALASALPRKSSRTSTQAVTVPSTAFRTATTTDVPIVSSSALTASGAVIADQKPSEPSFADSQMSAAIGRTTTTERNVVTMPRDRAAPAVSLGTRAGLGAATGTVLASDAADLALDTGEDALVRIEELRLHFAPAAETQLVDREQTGPRRELLPVGVEDALQDRAVAVVREDLLRGGCA